MADSLSNQLNSKVEKIVYPFYYYFPLASFSVDLYHKEFVLEYEYVDILLHLARSRSLQRNAITEEIGGEGSTWDIKTAERSSSQRSDMWSRRCKSYSERP